MKPLFLTKTILTCHHFSWWRSPAITILGIIVIVIPLLFRSRFHVHFEFILLRKLVSLLIHFILIFFSELFCYAVCMLSYLFLQLSCYVPFLFWKANQKFLSFYNLSKLLLHFWSFYINFFFFCSTNFFNELLLFRNQPSLHILNPFIEVPNQSQVSIRIVRDQCNFLNAIIEIIGHETNENKKYYERRFI